MLRPEDRRELKPSCHEGGKAQTEGKCRQKAEQGSLQGGLVCNTKHRKWKEPVRHCGSSAWLEGASEESGAGGALRKVGSVRR